MAAVHTNSIVDVELNSFCGIFRKGTCVTIGEGDQRANTFGFRCLRDGQLVDISDCTVAGYFVRADGETVVITGAVNASQIAYVNLPQACYAVEGQFSLAIKLTSGSLTGTMRIVDGVVVNTTTDTVVDPGTVITDIEALIAAIAAAEEALEDVAESIPQDYSEMSANVEQLQADAGLVDKFIDDFAVNGTRTDLTVTGTQSKYWNCEGSTAVLTDIGNPDFRAFDAVTVAAGEVYTVYSKIGTTHKARTWLVTDNSLNILAMPADEADQNLHRDVIVVPSGGTKLLLTSASTPDPGLKKLVWADTINTEDCLKYRGSIQALGYTTLKQCKQTGWYGNGAAYTPNITDLPAGFDTSKAITLFVFRKSFNSGEMSSGTDSVHLQVLRDSAGHFYSRIYFVSNDTVGAWSMIGGSVGASALAGKKVAIIGDSISTNGNPGTGSYANVPEIEITSSDVGVPLHAFLTYYDTHKRSGGQWVEQTLTLGGVDFTAADIGTDINFTPALEDVGKVVGKPLTYNVNSDTVWWEVAMAELGFTPIPVCWSGASITNHESGDEYRTAYAWHGAQIRKCGVRVPGTMTRTAPDVVIIYRGTNDFSHAPYTRLTEGTFDSPTWTYPDNDQITSGYGFKEGIAKTIQRIRQTYPNAKIFLCTLNVFKRVNKDTFPTNNGYNSLPQYNNAIRECADFFGCGLIEFDKCGITFENCYPTYIDDSENYPTHPNDTGHRVMGLKAIADLSAQYSAMS